MKIVFVSDTIYPHMHGGKEKRLYELSTRLAKHGHDIHIYTMHWWDDAAKTHHESGVTLHAICKKYEMYNGDRRSIKEGIMFGLACFKLFGVKFDVLDVDHMPFFPILTAWVVCTVRHKRFYGTWHEALTRKEWVDYMGVGGNIAAIIERICIRLPYSVIAASRLTEGRVKIILGRSNRISMIPSGIDSHSMETITPARKRVDVLAVSRLVKDKNVDVLIRAVALLKEERPNISCVIIGHGPERQRIARLITKHSLKKNVTVLEKLPSVYPYMKAANVFCSPSSREGFGIVTLEALACNTPVVTVAEPTNAASMLIKPGKNGSVVALDEKDLAGAIGYWLHESKSAEISKTVSRYDWEVLVKKQHKVYAS
ncbi:MAG TPA: glycosyltransferase family 4 protein [Candidatus Saccharimonadales bacterium]|nr:glycosyltransferase family 4 protein [Candidatus Saccharimonadales bacterium]